MIEPRLATAADVRDLLQAPRGPWVSLFLPTHRQGPEAVRDEQVFQALLRRAAEDLRAYGCRHGEAEAQLAAAHELLRAPDTWVGALDGLALFASRDETRVLRAPLAFREQVVVSTRPHLKQLLPLLEPDPAARFFLLTLSQAQARLFRGGAEQLEELELPEVVRLAEDLRHEAAERTVQAHSGGPVGKGGRGPSLMFHGHGDVGTDDPKARAQRHYRQVAANVAKALEQERAPLVLVGVKNQLALYREVEQTPPRIEVLEVSGNPDRLAAHELQARAQQALAPLRARARLEVAARCRAEGGGPLAVADPVRAHQMAGEGRVELLVVAGDREVWATLDPEPVREPELLRAWEPGAVDLLDLAAAETLLRGGEVRVVPAAEVPNEGTGALVAGVLRY
ncbi:MAG: hypothetical protein AB7N76_27940 [Planctomycetota bacterium]